MSYRNYSITNGFTVNLDGTGDFRSIASAYAAAPIGTTIGLMPGTYPETFEILPGINLAAMGGSDDASTVILTGSPYFQGDGTASLFSIELHAVDQPAFSFLGSVAGGLILDNCNIIGVSGTNQPIFLFDNNSSGSFIRLNSCREDILGATMSYFFSDSPGTIRMRNCFFDNTANSTSLTSIEAGRLVIDACTVSGPIYASSSAAVNCFAGSQLNCGPLNSTPLTVASSGNGFVDDSYLYAGTAAALVVNTPTVFTVSRSTFKSDVSGNNAVTGTGTVNISDITWIGAATEINCSTINALTTTIGKLELLEPLSVSNGGTGDIVTNPNAVLIAGTTTTDPIVFAPPVLAGYVLTDNGVGNPPTFQPASGGSSIFVSSTITGVDAITSDSTLFYTPPVGYNFLPVMLFTSWNTITDFLDPGAFSVGTNASDYNNYTSVNGNWGPSDGSTGTSTLVSLNFTSGPIANNSTPVYIKNASPATATVALSDITVIGYLYS